MVNKWFLHKNLYLLRMNEIDSVIYHLNAFNTIVNKWLSMDVKITEEEKCFNLLFSFPDSWYSLVVVIGIDNTTINIDNVVASLVRGDEVEEHGRINTRFLDRKRSTRRQRKRQNLW